MRRSVSYLVILGTLTACSADPPANTVADVNAAAQKAQSDIDTYAANTLEPVPLPSPIDGPVRTDPIPSPAVKAAAAPNGAEAAADVVRRYFTLIAARKYPAAYRRWGAGGTASGMTQRQFAGSFAKYATYNAKVGTPGEIDAGAGQRYVEIPVKVSGTLARNQRPFRLEGVVTLHRVGDIDGATAAERDWHIRDIALKPSPDAMSAALSGSCDADPVRVTTRDDSGRNAMWRHDADTARPGASGCTKTY